MIFHSATLLSARNIHLIFFIFSHPRECEHVGIVSPKKNTTEIYHQYTDAQVCFSDVSTKLNVLFFHLLQLGKARKTYTNYLAQVSEFLRSCCSRASQSLRRNRCSSNFCSSQRCYYYCRCCWRLLPHSAALCFRLAASGSAVWRRCFHHSLRGRRSAVRPGWADSDWTGVRRSATCPVGCSPPLVLPCEERKTRWKAFWIFRAKCALSVCNTLNERILFQRGNLRYCIIGSFMLQNEKKKSRQIFKKSQP